MSDEKPFHLQGNFAPVTEELTATEGRIEGRHGAARLLAINPHTLRSRMRRLGVDWRRFRVREN